MWYLRELTLIAIISINVSSAEVANELTMVTTDLDTSGTDVEGLVESMIFKRQQPTEKTEKSNSFK